MMKRLVVALLVLKLCWTYPAQNVYNYKEALKLSLLFYEAQRSGKLPDNNRIHWRGDSALNDKGLNGEDLTGGYYDAPDFVKFGFTIAYTITMLSWGLLIYEDAYKKIGQYDATLEAIKWGTDYIVKCHPSREEFYAQVGDFPIDHKFWGRPEELNMTRPAYIIDPDKPGSDVAAEASAALAASSIIFNKIDHTYAQKLLNHSLELYDLAYKYQGLYLDTYPSRKHYYENESYGDELAWAAIWLFKARKYTKYGEAAKNLYKEHDLKSRPSSFFYNTKTAGVQLLMAQEFRNVEYLENVREFCEYATKKELRTPKGLVYINKFGTLAHAANIAFICLQAADLDEFNTEYLQFAQEQIRYILGSTGRSFLVGYGTKYPKQPHHAASSCKDLPAPCNWDDYNSTKPNPQILYGALVSGPAQNDRYEDVRDEYLYNEVTIDYNAGLQNLLAGLLHYELT